MDPEQPSQYEWLETQVIKEIESKMDPEAGPPFKSQGDYENFVHEEVMRRMK